MNNQVEISDINFLFERDLVENFKKVAEANNTTAKEILLDFMKDYIVSNGHPEQVINKWPWNKQVHCGTPLTAEALIRMAKRPLHFDEDGNLTVDEDHPLL